MRFESEVSELFEQPQVQVPFPDELEALSEHRKAMSWFYFSEESVQDSDPEYHELLERMVASGCAIRERREHGMVQVFVTAPGQGWRVSAFEILKAAFRSAWSLEAEAMTSMLLGYPDDAVRSWIAACERSSMGWGVGPTIILALNDDQRHALDSVGWRQFGSYPFASGGVAIRVSDGRVLKMKAAEKLCGGFFARCQVDRALLPRMFGDRSSAPDFQTALEPDVTGAELNASLRSCIQELRDDEWLAPWEAPEAPFRR